MEETPRWIELREIQPNGKNRIRYACSECGEHGDKDELNCPRCGAQLIQNEGK